MCCGTFRQRNSGHESRLVALKGLKNDKVDMKMFKNFWFKELVIVSIYVEATFVAYF